MTAVPKRAQNYIPISDRNKMKFAAEPRRVKTQLKNISYLDDRRIQKQPANSARPRPVSGTAQNAARRQIKTASTANTQRKITPNASYYKMMQGGEIAIPLPRTNTKTRNRQNENVSASAAAFHRPQGVVSTILLIAVVFGILSFLLARNATIANLSFENSKIEKSITTLTQSNDQLKLDITLKEDLGYIQERAAQLQMGSPGTDQVTYLPEDNTGVQAAAPAQDTQDTALKDTSFSLSNLFKEIKSWLE
jgi:cell division protein FtsB